MCNGVEKTKPVVSIQARQLNGSAVVIERMTVRLGLRVYGNGLLNAKLFKFVSGSRDFSLQ